MEAMVAGANLSIAAARRSRFTIPKASQSMILVLAPQSCQAAPGVRRVALGYEREKEFAIGLSS